MRRGRRDRNHTEIREALAAIPGVSVFDTADIGGGFPDLVIGFRERSILLEVKDGELPPSERRLTPAEQRFFDNWTGEVYVVHSVAEAFRAVGIRLEVA